MNHFELLSTALSSSSSDSEKLRGATMQQISARGALLAATLEGNLGRMLATCNRGNTSLLGNQNPRFGFHTLPTPMQNDVRAGVFSSAMMSQHQHPSSLFAGAGSPTSQRFLLVDASVERRRLDNARLQVMHQQALLALTEERPSRQYGHTTSDSLGAIMLLQGGAGGGPFEQKKKHITNLCYSPAVLPRVQRLSPDGGTLAALGSSMRKKSSTYVDASSLSDPNPTDLARRRTRGGVTEPFPEKLHRMLVEMEEAGNDDIMSFFPHGRAFGIHDPERFVGEVMPNYFKQSRLSSFQRQLNLYGFTRITSAPNNGGYYHELFLKGRPALSYHMRRVGVNQGEDRHQQLKTGIKKKADPDFYSMNPVGNPSML